MVVDKGEKNGTSATSHSKFQEKVQPTTVSISSSENDYPGSARFKDAKIGKHKSKVVATIGNVILHSQCQERERKLDKL